MNQTTRLLSSLWVSCTGSASDWCAQQEALDKGIDTIKHNTIHVLRPEQTSQLKSLLQKSATTSRTCQTSSEQWGLFRPPPNNFLKSYIFSNYFYGFVSI